jgi:hypothetical protein
MYLSENLRRRVGRLSSKRCGVFISIVVDGREIRKDSISPLGFPFFRGL